MFSVILNINPTSCSSGDSSGKSKQGSQDITFIGNRIAFSNELSEKNMENSFFIDKENNVSLFFNGNLYNKRELFEMIQGSLPENNSSTFRSDKSSFDCDSVSVNPLKLNAVIRTSSDLPICERKLIISLYKKYGFEHTLKLLNGHFSMILLDNNVQNENDVLYVAVDPFASIPLYILETNEPMGSNEADVKSLHFSERNLERIKIIRSEMNENSPSIRSSEALNSSERTVNELSNSSQLSEKYVPILSGTYCSFHLSYKVFSSWKKDIFLKRYFDINIPSSFYDNIDEIKVVLKEKWKKSIESQYFEKLRDLPERSAGKDQFSAACERKINELMDADSKIKLDSVSLKSEEISFLGIDYLVDFSSESPMNCLDQDFHLRNRLKNMKFGCSPNRSLGEYKKNMIYPLLDKSFIEYYMSIHPKIRFIYKEKLLLSVFDFQENECFRRSLRKKMKI
jgi:hypothetical protein